MSHARQGSPWPVLLLVLATVAPALSQPLPCRALPGISGLPQFSEAAMQVTSADAEDGACRVRGYVRPNVEFALQLPPAERWTSRLVMEGCGGNCGELLVQRCAAHVSKGHACVVTDTGHRSTAGDSKWAFNNLAAELDFAIRGPHVALNAAKAITAAHYGRPSERSYYHGCSTGGRHALLFAQRFPHDFDGIVAGAPLIHTSKAALQRVWTLRQNLDERGAVILGAVDVARLAKAVLASCDALDGIADSVIADPRACRFDPAALQCGSAAGECLSAAQVEVARRIYRGPSAAQVRFNPLPGPSPGSEPNWLALVPGQPSERLANAYLGDQFRYLIHNEDPGPAWTLADLDVASGTDRFGVMDQLLGAGDPDLRDYSARGGKLIVYHGWRDTTLLPSATLDYVDKVRRVMGEPEAERLMRLFMIPGTDHCVGGPGPWQIDWTDAIANWVETGRAPDSLPARREGAASTVTEQVFAEGHGPGARRRTRTPAR